jgi:hypothetical protein
MDYDRVASTGCNVIFNGNPAFRGDTGLSFIVQPHVGWRPGVIGFTLGDDIPISKLEQANAEARHLAALYPGMVFPALVSAVYTRLLDYLEAPTYEVYLHTFMELAPMLTPMLCHYPVWRDSYDPEPSALQQTLLNWRHDYWYNLRLVGSIAVQHQRQWWMWVQVTAHRLYEWEFLPIGFDGIMAQILAGYAAGARGFGYYGWSDIEEFPGIKRNPEHVSAINRALSELLESQEGPEL